MTKSRLAKMLLEDKRATAENGSPDSNDSNLTKLGLDQINNIHQLINTGLRQWSDDTPEYHPLVEIAKLALSTDDDHLRFKCHAEIAKYEYPQIRSLEVQSKEDKEVKITVELAGYAKKAESIEIEAEDIEIVNEDVAEKLQKHNSTQDVYMEQVLKQSQKD